MSKDNVSELIQKNSSSSRNSSQLPHTENHQRKHQQHQHQQNQQHSQNFGLTHFTSMTNKKFLFRSHRTLSTCLPDEMPSKSLNTTHNSLDIHCSNDDNHIKTIKPRVLMSQSSFELITDKSIHNVDEVSEKKQDEIHWDYSSSYCSGNINVTSALNTSPINISPSDYNSSTSSRNILRRQHQQQEQQCTVETSPPLHTSSSISNE
ncbi:unnamed protein product [Trichobilharzia regenti]|nr:unnamed protein product [Trichobilharzia regenti]